MTATSSLWVETAARIFCQQQLTDYLAAKRKAQHSLSLPPNLPMPDNLSVEAAVVRYQQLYGGTRHQQHLRAMREAALNAMRLLAPLPVYLVGPAVTGAVTTAHRVQLHCQTDNSESVDFRLHDLGIPFQQDERTYRFTDGCARAIPLLRFEAGQMGIDLAVFDHATRARPLSPVSGRAAKRMDARAVTALLDRDRVPPL